jgi:hypothetical protein
MTFETDDEAALRIAHEMILQTALSDEWFKTYASRLRAEWGRGKAEPTNVKRLDAERMIMADALQEIFDYPLDRDVINAAAQMKFIAVRAFTKSIVTPMRGKE